MQRQAFKVVTELSTLGLLKDRLRLSEAFLRNESAREIDVGGERVGGTTQSLPAGPLCLRKLPQRQVLPNQPTISIGTLRITVDDLPVGLRCFVQFSCDTRVGLRHDRQPLALAGALPEVERLGKIFARSPALRHAFVLVANCVVSPGEVWVTLNSMLQQSQSCGRVLFSETQTLCFHSLERRCGGLSERRVEFLHR